MVHEPGAMVCFSLLVAVQEAKGKAFVFSSDKLLGRCSRQTKARILAALDAGMIKVRRNSRQAPVVTPMLKGWLG